jgi:hypothetical protein
LHYCAATCISSAFECFAGVCGSWIHCLMPMVEILAIHFPGKNILLAAGRADALQKVDTRSPFARDFGRPTDSSFNLSRAPLTVFRERSLNLP